MMLYSAVHKFLRYTGAKVFTTPVNRVLLSRIIPGVRVRAVCSFGFVCIFFSCPHTSASFLRFTECLLRKKNAAEGRREKIIELHLLGCNNCEISRRFGVTEGCVRCTIKKVERGQ